MSTLGDQVRGQVRVNNDMKTSHGISGPCCSMSICVPEVSWTGTMNYITQYLKYVMTCNRPWYLLLAPNFIYATFLSDPGLSASLVACWILVVVLPNLTIPHCYWRTTASSCLNVKLFPVCNIHTFATWDSYQIRKIAGKTFQAFWAHAHPAIRRILQEAIVEYQTNLSNHFIVKKLKYYQMGLPALHNQWSWWLCDARSSVGDMTLV